MKNNNISLDTKKTDIKTEIKNEKLIRPYIREAILIGVAPSPDYDSAIEIGTLLRKNWDGWKDSYLKMIADATSESKKNLFFADDEKAKDKWEGLARIIDFPRLYCCRDDLYIFDTRATISICIKGAYSSKLWGRAGIYELKRLYGIPVEKLKYNINMYHNIVKRTCKWLLSKIKGTRGIQITYHGKLETSSFGINDKSLRSCFEKITNERIPLSTLLQDQNIKKQLSLYFDKILGIPNSLEQYDVTKDSEDYLWFTSPVFIKTKKKTTELREVLYLMRSQKNIDQAVGLRYDDSYEGDLPRKSALEVARWIGTRI